MQVNKRFAAALLPLLAVSAASHGQAQLLSAYEEVEANAWVREWNGQVNNNHGLHSSNAGLDYNNAEFRSLSEHGFSGYGNGWHNTPFFPSNPGVGGSFLGFGTNAGAEACQFSSDFGNHQEEGAWGWTDGTLTFELFKPMFWSWSGSWQGQTLPVGHYSNAHAEMHLEDSFGGIYVNEVRDSLQSVGDWNEPFSHGGLLNPGIYTISWTVLAEVYGWHGAQAPLGCVPVFMNGNFNLTDVPTPGATALLGLAGLAAARRRR